MPKIMFAALLCLFLSGCIIGEYEKDKNRRPVPPLPAFRDFWEKADMTDENLKLDWIECGGNDRGNFTVNNNVYRTPPYGTVAERQEEQLKKAKAISQCMRQKGYLFTGYGGEVSPGTFRKQPEKSLRDD